jgi:hypothetical protein
VAVGQYGKLGVNIMAKKKERKPEFQVSLNNVGHTFANGSYGKLTDTNAVKLLERMCVLSAKMMVGEKNLSYVLLTLGMKLLKETYKPHDIIPEIKENTLETMITDFEMKPEMKAPRMEDLGEDE